MAVGRLRVYLGAAPGVGKTYAMLDEARRRLERGGDVVVGVVDDHGRAVVAELAAGLETVGSLPAGLDVDAVLRRHPTVVLVDDLGRAQPEGQRHARRWEAAEELLAGGIDVLATTDIGAIASLADVVERITGVRPVDSVPDRLLAGADQIELIDASPQALRRRLAHGNIFPPQEVDAALSSTFRPDALAALRELALRWTADHVRRARPVPAVREGLVVGLPIGPECEALLRRAALLAQRTPGARLHAVHVLPSKQLPRARPPDLDRLRELAEGAGATYQQVIGDDVAAALVEVAVAEGHTQIIVGDDGPPRRWWPRRRGTAQRLAAGSAGGVDVHVVELHRRNGSAAMPPERAGLSGQRRALGLLLAVFGPVLLALGLQPSDGRLGLTGETLLFLVAVVVVARVGGLWPALLCAVVGTSLLNYFFIPPVHTFWVSERNNAFALVVFVLVATLVSGVVDRAAALAAQAARASAESRTLAAIAGGVLRGEEALPALLERVRGAFGMTSVALLERVTDPSPEGGGIARWRTAHAIGPIPPGRPEEADVQAPDGDDLVLALTGHALAAADRKILRVFAAQARSVLERDRLEHAARLAARLEATERLRDALLAAVGHDLRTPLASATAAVTSLRSADVEWLPAEREELLATAEESLTRLGRLVGDLLDLSRLRAGVLTISEQVVWCDDVVATALGELGSQAADVAVGLPVDPPAVRTDPALLQRALVNVLGNALRYSPPGVPPALTVSALGPRVELRVIDRGPGIPAHDRERVFAPFQRLGDTDNTAGLGLGLALSRGLVEAMHGTLEAEETPGGGLTMVLALPAADGEADGASSAPGRREREATA